jgi:carbonic anhydrase/acetyltransferase-like protein (isoleucine patch superfamily)
MVSIGHLCVVHGAIIGSEALVGNGAAVLDGVIVGRRWSRRAVRSRRG